MQLFLNTKTYRKIGIKFLLFLFLFFSFSLLSAQKKTTYELVEVLDKTNGLSSNQVTFVYRYEQNLMFIGTKNGVNAYDGYSFKLHNTAQDAPFPLNGNKVTSIEIDTALNVWVATDNGINKVNGFTRTNQSYFNLGNQQFPPNTKGNSTNNLVAQTSDGQIWGVSNGVLYKLNTDSVVSILADKYFNIRGLVADNQGNLFFINEHYLVGLDKGGNLLFENKDTTIQKGAAIFGLRPNLFKNGAGEIILASSGYQSFFKVSPSGTLSPLNKEQCKVVHSIEMVNEYAAKKGRSIPYIYHYLEDSQGIQWLGTNFGLVKIVPKHDYFSKIPALKGVSCRGLYEHSNGLIFGGTYSIHDLFIYNPTTNEVEWIEGVKNVYDIQQLNGDTLMLVCDAGPTMLFDAQKKAVIAKNKVPNINNNFYDIYIDHTDTIWIAQNDVIFLASVEDPLNFIPLELSDEDPLSNVKYIMQVEQFPNGNFLIATGKGLFEYQKGKGTIHSYTFFQSKEKQLSDNFVRQFAMDSSGNAWIGTSNGLDYLEYNSKNITKSYSSADGLCDNLIFSLILENDSTLWLGTDAGLSKLDTQKEIFINYHEKDGISNSEFNTNSYLKSRDSTLYLGGINGLTIFNHNDLPLKENDFTPFVPRYYKGKSSEETIGVHYLEFNQFGTITMETNENYLELDFSNGDFLNPQQNTFACYLEGFEHNWKKLINQNNARYTNLKQGKYTLKVKAANEDGIWGSKILSVPIIVHRPFYEQWWFYSLITFLICAFFTLIYVGFQVQENKNNRIRYRIATDLHDDVSNSLNNIRMIARDLAKVAPQKIATDLERIQHMSSSAIGHVTDVIWSIDRDLGSLQHLIFVMEDYLDDVVRPKKIQVSFEKINLNLDNHLKILVRRNLLLIYKEAVSNAIKHTRVNKLTIQLKNYQHRFVMSILNEFDQKKVAEKSTKRGIPNMQRRAKYINGQLAVTSKENSFSISLTLNYCI